MSLVFDSFANIVKVTDELEYLPQSARDLFGSRPEMALSSFSWNKHKEWGDKGKWACRWASAGADLSNESAGKLKPIGRVLLCMDLFRERLPSFECRKLDHAETSLLTCGFVAGKDASEETYDVEYFKFDSFGWPIESDSFIRHAGGRLLEYMDKKPDRPWTERSWLFTAPLESIHNPDAFRTEIADPFWAILRGGTPEKAFAQSKSTCIFD